MKSEVFVSIYARLVDLCVSSEALSTMGGGLFCRQYGGKHGEVNSRIKKVPVVSIKKQTRCEFKTGSHSIANKKSEKFVSL